MAKPLQVIAEHSKVIAAFVDTSDTPWGKIALKALFAAADADGNGTLDKEEVWKACDPLERGCRGSLAWREEDVLTLTDPQPK